MTEKWIRSFLISVTIVLLTACGGGSIQQAAIDKIAAYAKDGDLAPVLKNYVDAEITGVTEENINSVNRIIESLYKENADTKEEIQSIVDAYIMGLSPDVTPPVITLTGENPITLNVNDTYVDDGATAEDDKDTEVVVVITGSVDSSTVGTYTMYYDATDRAGNHAQTLSRTVNVVEGADITPPIITIIGENPLVVDLNGIYQEAGATAMDDSDGNVSVVTTGSVDMSTLGVYTISYDATDSAGNSVTQTRSVHVSLPDVTPPVITMMGDNPVEVKMNHTYVDPGATAVDDRDGEVAVVVTGSVNTSVVGTHTLTYIAKDDADNTSSLTRTVNVIEWVNSAPLAEAGGDRVTKQGSRFVLDGSASSDDEAVVRYVWIKGITKLGEGKILELNATDLGLGKSVITLVVIDSEDLQDSDRVDVEVLYGIKGTGQTVSYDEDGIEIEDHSLKDNGFYQKGVERSYSRDDINGTVVDLVSGLMWQDNGRVNRVWLTIDNHNKCQNDTSSYACSDTSGETAVSYCEDLNLSGYEDWRLPSVKEMQRIVHYGHRNPSIDRVFKYSTAGYYWTITPVAYYEDYAWVVNFEYGDANGYLKGSNVSLRCVRDRI